MVAFITRFLRVNNDFFSSFNANGFTFDFSLSAIYLDQTSFELLMLLLG